MTTISITLKDAVFEQMKAAAEAQHCSVEEYAGQLLQKNEPRSATDMFGIMSEDADLLDEIVAEAMRARETLPMRAGGQ